MSSNFKRESGTLDSFFMPREKKPKNATNTAICATSSHELVMPNEDNFVSDSQIDNQIQDVWDTSKIWRTLGFSEFESVVDFRSRNVFSSCMKALNILPTSTADCERGFSDMNLTITDLRTRLNIENVSDLMFISINGPSVADFNPRPYIKIWLRDHRSAVSTPRGKERKEIDDENKMQKL
ncbi:uncharacterized protein LOC132937054, partial [Metopolophium dirhodum]